MVYKRQSRLKVVGSVFNELKRDNIMHIIINSVIVLLVFAFIVLIVMVNDKKSSKNSRVAKVIKERTCKRCGQEHDRLPTEDEFIRSCRNKDCINLIYYDGRQRRRKRDDADWNWD